jgi:cytochrome P450
MGLPPRMPLPRLAQTWLWVRRPTETMRWCERRYGRAFTVDLPPYTLAVFSDPDSIRTMFAAKPAEMHAGEVNRVLRSLVGSSSVLLLDGSEHMRHRKLLLPSFHGERMRLYGQTMAEITQRAIETWPLDEPFVLHETTQDITLEIILRTVFGADEGAQLTELKAQMKRMLAAGGHRLAFPVLIYLSEHPEVEGRMPWKWLLKNRERTDEMLYAQIAERRADPNASERKDVLAMLLQARDEQGEGLTDRELRDELMTALAAGHETTATALAWAFERILSQPEVLERLRGEVQDAGGVDAEPEKIAALPYLDATIKELLRLRPVVPIVGRVLKKPYTLGGYDLPAGTAVGACIYLAQRNPDVYPDPHAFKPERFLDTTPDPATWLPFGGGIRRCIGAAFATYEMKIVLATILARCELELVDSEPPRTIRRAITFYPEGGTPLRLLKRAA